MKTSLKILFYLALAVGAFGLGVAIFVALTFVFCLRYIPLGGVPWDMVPWYLHALAFYGLLTTSSYIIWKVVSMRKERGDGT